MTSLFDDFVAGDIRLANRIVMAPLTRSRAPQGYPTELSATYYQQRAEAGLLITEGVPISQQGQGYAFVPGIYTQQQIDAWRRVVSAVHAAGGKIAAQIWHVGRVSHTSLQPGGGAPVAPSAIQANTRAFVIHPDGSSSFEPASMPRELAAEEIPGIVQDFRRAARAAMEAGFDGVEIHGANGYLIDQFLRSGTNQRRDDYGGSIENRARFLLEVVQAVAEEAGPGRTGIRLSPTSPANDVFDPDPQPVFEYVVRHLARWPLSFVHVVEGMTGGARDYQLGDKPFDYAALRSAYREAGGTAAWMLNNGYTPEMAEAAIAEGRADLISFGRPFIANPDLVRRIRENAPLNAPDPTTFYGGGEKGYTDYPTLD